MKKLDLRAIIKDIESHTNETFDSKNRRHIIKLEVRIERYYADSLRKLALIEEALKSNGNENSLYNSQKQYTRDRFKD